MFVGVSWRFYKTYFINDFFTNRESCRFPIADVVVLYDIVFQVPITLRIWINKMYKRQQHITNTTKNSSTKTDINIVSITSILFCNVFFYKRNADVLNIFNTHLLSNSNVPQDFFFRFICKSSMHDFKCNYILILICNSVV